MRRAVLWFLFTVSCASGAPTVQLSEVEDRADAHVQVAIVGGGIAGLMTAYELERQGVSVEIFEMTDRLGGKIQTAHYGEGLSAEYGMQEMWSGSPLATLARELELDLEGEGAFSSVVLGGKLHAFTQDTSAEYLQSLFNAEEYAALRAWMKRTEALHMELRTAGMTPKLAVLNDVSFLTWLGDEKIPERVVAFLRLTLECELGTDADSFSALSGIAELRQYLFGEETALHVVGGNSRLIRALAGKIRGAKRLGARVTRVVRSREADGGIRVTLSYLRHNEYRQVTADRVVVAVPWLNLPSIQLDPPLPAEAWEALMVLGRGQYTVVHLLVDKKVHALWGGARAHPFPVLTPGKLGVVYGVTEPSPPSQPLEVFSLLLHGSSAREFHMAPLETKREELLQDLNALWPGFSSHVVDATVYSYHPAAIPYWPPGRSPYDERAQRLFQSFDGLYLAGDYLVSSHSEGAVVAARRQAKAIATELRR